MRKSLPEGNALERDFPFPTSVEDRRPQRLRFLNPEVLLHRLQAVHDLHAFPVQKFRLRV